MKDVDYISGAAILLSVKLWNQIGGFDDRFFVPRGGTRLAAGDKLLVITDNDEELENTYRELGINSYILEKNK